jgi:hypothetical protein
MNFAKRLLMVVGIASLAGTVGALLAPKTAHALVATLVQVVNTSANPVAVEEVRNPVQASGGGTVTGPTNFVLYVVPTGKRLIVEHFSSEAGMASSTTVNRYILAVADDPNNPGFTSFAHFIAPASSSPCGTCFPNEVEVVASQPIRMYVEAGQALVVNITFSGLVGANAFAFFGVSGYLVNVP